MNIDMVGDWSKFNTSITALADKKIIPLLKVQIDSSGKMLLKTLVGHVQTQDLNWTPLADETLKRKSSGLTYVDTGELINNLVLKNVINKADTYAVFVGAPNVVHSPSGYNLSEIMLYMEYGTFQNPARPLIQPTFDELKNHIITGLIDAMKSLLANI